MCIDCEEMFAYVDAGDDISDLKTECQECYNVHWNQHIYRCNLCKLAFCEYCDVLSERNVVDRKTRKVRLMNICYNCNFRYGQRKIKVVPTWREILFPRDIYP